VPILLGPILGPVLGGLIVDSVSWRWIFLVNIPVAAIALGLAARFLHADAGRADAGRFDWTGMLLLSPGLAGIVFGLSETETHGGVGAPIAWVPIAGGLLLVALFVRHALRAERPLIDVHLFRSAGFSAAAATTFLLGGALFGAMIVLPLYYQIARGENALTAGLLMAPQGLGAAMAMPIAGRLTDRVGGGRVALVGLVVMTLSTIPFAFIGAHTSYLLLALVLVVRGVGMGATMMPAMAAAYATLDHSEIPRATSALNVLQRIGGSLGTALLAVVLQHQLTARLGGGAGGTLGQVPDQVRLRIGDSLAAAFAHTFWWAVAIGVVGLVPTAILAVVQTRERRPGTADVATEAVG
jgi:EmrB/QacA subfamily drug resistance transporter